MEMSFAQFFSGENTGEVFDSAVSLLIALHDSVLV
jgi:hypothetical protein